MSDAKGSNNNNDDDDDDDVFSGPSATLSSVPSGRRAINAQTARTFILNLQRALQCEGMLVEHQKVQNAIRMMMTGKIEISEVHQVMQYALDQYHTHMAAVNSVERVPKKPKPRKRKSTSQRSIKSATKSTKKRAPPVQTVQRVQADLVIGIPLFEAVKAHPDSTYAKRCRALSQNTAGMKDVLNVAVHAFMNDIMTRMIKAARSRHEEKEYAGIAARRNRNTRVIRLPSGTQIPLSKGTYPMETVMGMAAQEEREDMLQKEARKKRVRECGTEQEKARLNEDDIALKRARVATQVAMDFIGNASKRTFASKKKQSSRSGKGRTKVPLTLDIATLEFALNEYQREHGGHFPVSSRTWEYFQAGCIGRHFAAPV